MPTITSASSVKRRILEIYCASAEDAERMRRPVPTLVGHRIRSASESDVVGVAVKGSALLSLIEAIAVFHREIGIGVGPGCPRALTCGISGHSARAFERVQMALARPGKWRDRETAPY